MHTEMHIGFRWDLKSFQIDELEEVMKKRNAIVETKKLTCPNGHDQEEGNFCSECGSKLSIETAFEVDPEYEWWVEFDEEGFYLNDSTIYMSVDSGYVCVDFEDCDSLLKPPTGELVELLNKYARPIACTFLFPDILEEGDDD